MNELTEQEWLEDLETTDVRQGRDGHLCYNGAFCCLGRGCELDERIEADDHSGRRRYFLDYRPISSLAKYSTEDNPAERSTPWSWMTNGQAEMCAAANDQAKMTFAEIAAWWRAGCPVGVDGNPVRVELRTEFQERSAKAPSAIAHTKFQEQISQGN